MLSPVTGFKWPNVKQIIAREKKEEENRIRKEDKKGQKQTNKKETSTQKTVSKQGKGIQ